MCTVTQTIQPDLKVITGAHFGSHVDWPHSAANVCALIWRLQFALHIQVGHKMNTLRQDVKEGLCLQLQGSEVGLKGYLAFRLDVGALGFVYTSHEIF